jgi:hypothetical protein
MAKYCELSDFEDSLVAGNVTEETLEKTDAYIDALLNQIGISPDSINPSDYPVLKQLAVYFASYLTCLEQTSGENDVYLQKSKSYEKLYEKFEKRLLTYGLTLKSEETTTSTTPFTIKLTRG